MDLPHHPIQPDNGVEILLSLPCGNFQWVLPCILADELTPRPGEGFIIGGVGTKVKRRNVSIQDGQTDGNKPQGPVTRGLVNNP